MILPNRNTYLLCPARTSARTAVVSLPSFPATHPPFITRENLPFDPTFTLDLRPSFCFLKSFSHLVLLKIGEIPIEYP